MNIASEETARGRGPRVRCPSYGCACRVWWGSPQIGGRVSGGPFSYSGFRPWARQASRRVCVGLVLCRGLQGVSVGPDQDWCQRWKEVSFTIIQGMPGSPSPRLSGRPGPWAVEAGLAEPRPQVGLSRDPGLVRSLPLYTGHRRGAHGRASRHPVCPRPAAGDLASVPHADARSGDTGEGGPRSGLEGAPGSKRAKETARGFGPGKPPAMPR